MFIKMIKSRRTEWLLTSVICLITLVFSIFLEFLMSLETNKYVDASTVIFMGIFCFASLFISFSGGNTRLFNLSVSMGGTRKSFIISIWIISLIKYGAVFLLGFIMHKIQHALLPGKQFADISFFFEPDICIILVFMLASVELVMGSLVLRFGLKIYWILWGIYMVLCMLPSRIVKAMERKGDSILKSLGIWIIDFISNITMLQVISIGVVAAVILTGISSYLIMTQDVTA
ncbi:MAG: hypothetical protein K2I03_09915 [Lachnospiraceae bacterium]|nr:hypothetical protein [Lachnospiraceae bacterium]